MNFSYENSEVEKSLEQMQARIQKKAELMKKIALYARSEIQQNFDAEGRPERWKPLSKGYMKLKQEMKGGVAGKILVFTGDLRRSFNIRYDDNTAEVFSGSPYAIKHQLEIGVPARPFMPDSKNPNIPPFDTDGIARIKEFIGGWLTDDTDGMSRIREFVGRWLNE